MSSNDDFYNDLLDTMTDGVYFLDNDRRITLWNKGAEKISGYRRDDVIGSRCADNILNHVDDKGVSLCPDDRCPAFRTLRTGHVVEADVFLHHKDGHRVPVSVRTTALRDKTGTIVGAVEVFRETSSRSESERKLKELEALTLLDILTMIGNRRHGEAQIQACMNELHRYGWPFGILFIDIDHFKQFNDQYGHDTGDAVLKMVAQTLATNVRSFDHVIRWGGEEFLVILINLDSDKLYGAAEKLRSLVSNSGLQAGSETLSVTVSVGATLCKPTDTPDSLVNRADALMYRSKNTGRNRSTLG